MGKTRIFLCNDKSPENAYTLGIVLLHSRYVALITFYTKVSHANAHSTHENATAVIKLLESTQV